MGLHAKCVVDDILYSDAVKYLESFINYEKIDCYDYRQSINLDRMKRLLAILGNPHSGIKTLHIAGSKGKGSTAAMVASILEHAGFVTGLYTSPHLIDFSERIRINNTNIGKHEISELVNRIRPAIDEMQSGYGERPSFFEVYTAIAFMYFSGISRYDHTKDSNRKVDFMVLETGLGGRLDATNVVMSLVSGITPISYEHTDKLGVTLTEIANEKCAIIKEDSICVSSVQDKEVLEVIERVSAEKRARLFLVGREVMYKQTRCDTRGQVFDLKGISGEYKNMEVKLLGAHQVLNAAQAVGIVESLKFYDICIKEECIREGLLSAYWPGRLEIINRNPFMVLDGAHNVASAKVLADAVRKIFDYKKLILVLGISKDKDIPGVCGVLSAIADEIVITKASLSRAAEPRDIEMHMGSKPCLMTGSVKEALEIARSKAGISDFILITGSLFVVGEAKAICQNESN